MYLGPTIPPGLAGRRPALAQWCRGDHDDDDHDGDHDEDEADSFVSISETLITACLRLFLITNSKIDRDNDDDDDSFVEELSEAMFLKIILAHLQLSVIIAPY